MGMRILYIRKLPVIDQVHHVPGSEAVRQRRHLPFARQRRQAHIERGRTLRQQNQKEVDVRHLHGVQHVARPDLPAVRRPPASLRQQPPRTHTAPQDLVAALRPGAEPVKVAQQQPAHHHQPGEQPQDPGEVDLRCECPIIIFFYSFKRVGGHRHTFLQSGQKTFLNFCQLRKYSAGLGSVTAINRHWERVRFRTVRDTIKGTSMVVEKFDIFRRAVQFATSILARAVFYLRPRPSHYLLFGVLARLQIVRQHGEFFLIS
jgi:hypothetical protein